MKNARKYLMGMLMISMIMTLVFGFTVTVSAADHMLSVHDTDIDKGDYFVVDAGETVNAYGIDFSVNNNKVEPEDSEEVLNSKNGHIEISKDKAITFDNCDIENVYTLAIHSNGVQYKIKNVTAESEDGDVVLTGNGWTVSSGTNYKFSEWHGNAQTVSFCGGGKVRSLSIIYETDGNEHVDHIVDGMTGSCGPDAKYTLHQRGEKTFEIVISGTGEISTYSPDIEWTGMWSGEPYKYNVIIEEGITSIGSYGFWKQPGLLSIELPDSLQTIGYAAFEKCTNLKMIDLPENLTSLGSTAFAGCNRLRSIIVPAGVTAIEGDTFMDCSSLASVVLEGPVTTIKDRAFADCRNLKTAYLSDSLENLSWAAFSNCYSLESINTLGKLTELGPSIFENCRSLETIPIPDTVTKIHGDALRGSGIKRITIPKAMTEIVDQQFENCSNLTTVKFQDSITKIGYAAFRGCTSLSEIELNEGLVTIMDQAFLGCTSLENITFPTTVTSIGNEAFQGAGLTSVIIPDGLTRYSWATFRNCAKLEKVTLSNHISSIPDDMFAGCIKLSSIDFPECVTSIGMDSFLNTGLTSVTIPAHIKSVGYRAFAGSAVKDVTIIGAAGGRMFYNCKNLVSAELKEGAASIPGGMFEECKNLESVSISDTVKSIEALAFSDCTNIRSLTIPSTVTTINDDLFHWGDPNLVSVTIGCQYKSRIGSIFSRCSNLKDITYTHDFDYVDADADNHTESCRYGDMEKGAVPHVYDSGCDPVCDLCKHERTDLVHTGGKATCTEKAVCEVCSKEYGEPKGHAWGDDFTVDTPATCTEDGTKSVHCANCDEIKDSTVIKAKGHIGGKATCTEKAVCEVCSKEYGEPKGHAWEDDFTVDTPATCTEDGTKSIHCADCDEVKDSTVIKAKGHTGGKVTCTEKAVCKVCGNEYGEPKGHVWEDDFTIDIPATCTKDGTKSVHCANCDSTKYSTVVPATGHTFVRNKCSVCGYVKRRASSEGGGSAAAEVRVLDCINGSLKVLPDGKEVKIEVHPDKGYVLETIIAIDKDGNEIQLTENDGVFFFKLPAGGAEISATFMEDNRMTDFFVDVPLDSYFYDSVLWAAENNITSGVDNTHFKPELDCTRAQVVTFLWRAAGAPEPDSAMSDFADLDENAYYFKAVNWAVENGITNGVDDEHFAPDAAVTRAQVVTFQYRAAGVETDGSNSFIDVPAGAYYEKAVNWAVESGITNGTSDTTFSPDDNCTRAQIVTFLFRAAK